MSSGFPAPKHIFPFKTTVSEIAMIIWNSQVCTGYSEQTQNGAYPDIPGGRGREQELTKCGTVTLWN